MAPSITSLLLKMCFTNLCLLLASAFSEDSYNATYIQLSLVVTSVAFVCES